MSKPAARVGDMHVCPMATPGTPPVPHVGGPILPPGVPTVLIGGMPAAVIGGMCTCVGPPDSIALGSTGVLIGGTPAARVGDSTGHGGSITVGCLTVLIGDGGSPGPMQVGTPCSILGKIKPTVDSAEEATEQEQLKKDLNVAVAQQSAAMPAKDHAKAQAALTSYQGNRDAADMAALSEAVYENDSPPGFTKMDPKDFGFDDKFMNAELDPNSNSGFKSAIYKTPKGEIVVAFAGTEKQYDDIVAANLGQGTGMQTDQYDRSMIIGRQMKARLGPDGFRTTGHSLGGGLASAACSVSGARGTTMNPAGLHRKTTRRDLGVSDQARKENEDRIDAYHNSHDPLNRAQNNRKKTLFGLLGFVGLAIGLTGVLPGAQGDKIVVKSKKKGILEHGIGELKQLLEDAATNDIKTLQKLFKC